MPFACPHDVTVSMPPLFFPCCSDEDGGDWGDVFPAADQEGQLGVGSEQCLAGVQRRQA